MLRIAIDVHAIGQRATGNETYAEGLMRAFETFRPPDMELLFYHIGDFPRPAAVGSPRRLWPSWAPIRVPLVTPWRLMRDRIDLAHFQYFGPPLSPCPLILTVHDLSYEHHPEFFPPTMALGMRLVMPRMVKLARHLIAVSHATRDDLISRYQVDPSRITVIHNGVHDTFRPIDDADHLARSTARFGVDRPFILCVGNLGTRKNQSLLVRAFARLARTRAFDHDLVLVGKQSFGGERIPQEARLPGIAGRVHLCGFVDTEELIALYNRATFSVYPSLYEGFGLPVLESMACGTPVITSNLSSMPEIAGDAALLVDPRDEPGLAAMMSRLLDSPALRASLRAAGLERSRRFSWQAAAAQTADVYRHVAGNAP